jgi:hypothetical protein
MVCNKCQKLIKGTSLATPEVKKKSELYYGSSASSSSASTKGTGASKSTTLGQSGVVKSKLLSKSAKNPYAQYSRYAHPRVLALLPRSTPMEPSRSARLTHA